MSMSPHQIFGRLQELKKWQQTHENLLRRSNVDEHFEKTSKSTYRSYSPNTSNNLTENSVKNAINHNINPVFENASSMQIKGTQGKNFEQILEEKLNEYAENSTSQPHIDNSRTKKPFLKKGSGLLKYNLKPEEYKKLIGNKYSNTLAHHQVRPKSVQNSKKSVISLPERPKTSGQERQSNVTRKSQNCMRTTKNSTKKNLQRSKATVSVSSKKIEPLKLNNCTKNNENLKGLQQCNLKKLQHAEEGLKIDRYHTQEPILTETDRTSPKLKDFIETIMKNTVNSSTFTPLKAPDISIKPKESWYSTAVTKFENDNLQRGQWVDNFQHSEIKNIRDTYSLQGVLHSEWKNGNVNTMAQIDNTKVEYDHDEHNIHMKSGARKSLSYTPNTSEQNLYEKALETELMIFEALERRTEQSGFCSTNTSIIQLLTSSPSRFNFKNSDRDRNCPIFDKIIDINEEIEDQPVKDENATLTPTSDRFETASEENDPAHDFRNGAFSTSEWPAEDYQELPQQIINQKFCERYSESEEESEYIQMQNELKNKKDVSVNTDNISLKCRSYSSEQSDSAEEYSKQSHKTRQSCIESPDRSPKTSESCLHCGFLIRNKIEECETELNNLKLEKNKLVAIRKKMAKDQKEYEHDLETKKKQFEQQKRRFELEMEEERKKISEKMAGEMPRRDLKSKLQQRKDREELNDLRIELSETKELMKLRETKNAMSIARLRNQVKQLEKNNAELKAENEKLLKEKSKLVAQQKTFNKSSETKMLKEISKNISKLTEEKFKNQNLKNNSSSEELNQQGGCKGDSQLKPKRSSTGLKKTVAFSCHGHGEGPVEENNTHNKVSNNTIEDECIEEKYKSLFGGQDVIIESTSNDQGKLVESKKHSGMNKTEKVLEDGTKEIRYSNGNMKLISENGTVRYYYASNDIWHTNFVDGTEVLEFPNGQSEKRFKDGKCLIFFPDGLVQTIFPNGTEEVKYPDGSKLVTKKDGERMLFLSNGQVEIHTKDQKRREYPDGTVKILYPDGSQETRYSNGRIRIKNNKGDIILDTGERND